jgi:biopolymer transport protein ExbD
MLSISRRKAEARSEPVDMKPFINFFIVLIPVFMLSAEFCKTAFHTVQPTERGSRPEKVSNCTSSTDILVICLGDSTITIADNNRILAGFSYRTAESATRQLNYRLGEIQSAMQPEIGRVIIASDNEVKYQKLIDVMDVVKKNGFGNVGVTRLRS